MKVCERSVKCLGVVARKLIDERIDQAEAVAASRLALAQAAGGERLGLRGFGLGQAFENVLQVLGGIDALATATARHRINHRAALPGLGMPNLLGSAFKIIKMDGVFPLTMNLVAADVRRLKFCFTKFRWSLLTSAATVQGFKARIFREILTRGGEDTGVGKRQHKHEKPEWPGECACVRHDAQTDILALFDGLGGLSFESV